MLMLRLTFDVPGDEAWVPSLVIHMVALAEELFALAQGNDRVWLRFARYRPVGTRMMGDKAVVWKQGVIQHNRITHRYALIKVPGNPGE